MYIVVRSDIRPPSACAFFFFNDTATTEIYTLSLHDALPIYPRPGGDEGGLRDWVRGGSGWATGDEIVALNLEPRSEEHTSELQSHLNLVCRLLLEKKKSSPSQRHR